jgi:hypothetical protein
VQQAYFRAWRWRVTYAHAWRCGSFSAQTFSAQPKAVQGASASSTIKSNFKVNFKFKIQNSKFKIQNSKF